MHSTLPAQGVYSLRPHGRLDAPAAAAVVAMVRGELARAHPRRIVIDLRAVRSISQSGVAALVACRRRAARAGVGLELLCDGGPALALLEEAGLHRVFDIRTPA